MIFVIGLAITLRPDSPAWLRMIAVLAGLAVAGGAIIAANLFRGRKWRDPPLRVGFVEAAALVLVPPIAALLLDEGLVHSAILAAVSIAVAVVLYALASFGILPLLVGQAQHALTGAVATASVAVRAMAMMLASAEARSLSSGAYPAPTKGRSPSILAKQTSSRSKSRGRSSGCVSRPATLSQRPPLRLRAEFTHEIAEGDFVAVGVAVDGGTHKGEYMGIAPTGELVTWTETHIWRIEDGRITEHWGNVSLFEIHRMIGSHDISQTLA